jgi:SNF2 family DNA or RNA helicase
MLKEWALAERDKERNLRSMSKATDATLDIPKEMSGWMRPYQRAGAAFLARGNMLNGDDMGLGKSVETVAALIHQGLDIGLNLIVAPKSSCESVWPAEICVGCRMRTCCRSTVTAPQVDRSPT